MPHNDEDLVALAKQGNREAFDQLYSRWAPKMFALALKIVGNEADACDVCQEAFLKAYTKICSFRHEAKFSTWIHAITHNTALNFAQKRVGEEKKTARYGEREQQEERMKGVRTGKADPAKGASAIPVGHDVPDMPVLSSSSERGEGVLDRQREVKRAMADLPAKQREVVRLKIYDEMTLQEIAERLKVPLSTVKTRLYDGFKGLRRKMPRDIS